jgi:dihydrofolate synthase/folylpolyglutamate synthase
MQQFGYSYAFYRNPPLFPLTAHFLFNFTYFDTAAFTICGRDFREMSLGKEYREIENYLDSFINYERRAFFPYRKSLKLKRVRALFNSLGIPYQKLKVIHIAGTKGKGSTAHFCANLLASSGYKVGLYTSPHFFSFRERIKMVKIINSQDRKNKKEIKSYLISKNDVVSIVKEIRPELERLRFTEELGKLTFFEVYTAVAFKYFLEKNVDFTVIEVGLGGRLDATNIVNPLLSIITHIGYDHTDKLGNRLAEIAYEKAGIIKRKKPIIISKQRYSVLSVLRKKSRQRQTRMFLSGEDFRGDNIKVYKNFTLFDFTFYNFKLKKLKIILKGKHQVENACLALAATVLLQRQGISNNRTDFQKALHTTFLPGRFEIVKRTPLIIIDIAHNPSSTLALTDNLQLYFPAKKVILVFAASKDKDVRRIIKNINYTHLILSRFNNPRSLSPSQIKNMCRVKGAFLIDNIKDALQKAEELYDRNSLILITGSLFLASEAKKLIDGYGRI